MNEYGSPITNRITDTCASVNTTKKKVVVLAPTGVVALNVKGQTIHSFFRFKPGIIPDRVKKLRAASDNESIYRKLDAIVIDEISILRAVGLTAASGK